MSREKHHRHLINDSGIRGAIFYAEDDCVGYAYISPEGHIGPLGVAQPKVLQENMNAAFDFARQLTRVKSPSEFFELSAAHARKQFETFTEQAKHLTTLAQKVTTDAAQPPQSEVAKTFKKSA